MWLTGNKAGTCDTVAGGQEVEVRTDSFRVMGSIRGLIFFSFSHFHVCGVHVCTDMYAHACGVLRLMLEIFDCSSVLVSEAGSLNGTQSSLIWLLLLDSVFWGFPVLPSEAGSTGSPPLLPGISPGFWGSGNSSSSFKLVQQTL